MDRREFLKSTGAAAAAATTATAAVETAIAAPAVSKGLHELRLAMPWTDGVAGPADQAHRLGQRITTMSEGRIRVVPSFGVANGLAAVRAGDSRPLFRQRARQPRCPSRPRLLRRPPRRSRPQPATPADVDRDRRRPSAVGRARRRSRCQADAGRTHRLAQLPSRHRAHRCHERPRRPQGARAGPRARRRPRARPRAGVWSHRRSSPGAMQQRRRFRGRMRRRYNQLRARAARRRPLLGWHQHQPPRHGAVARH